MVLNRWLHTATLLFLTAGAGAQPAQDPSPGEVNLPLSDYLALVNRVEAVERERTQRAARREAPVAEVTAQRVSLTLSGDEAEVVSELEVLVQGRPEKPIVLPLAGIAERAEVTPATAAVTATGGGLALVALEPGRYAVRVWGHVPLERNGGVGRLPLAPVVAPVAEIRADLPAELGWSSPGKVVVEETEQDGRRRVRLAASRGEAGALELRRQVDGGDAARLLARGVVLTLFQLRPDGARRHDVVFYEVARGGLASFAVDLPPGLEVDQVGTDEGAVVPVTEAQRLTVHRQRQLQGTGYLVLTSTPATERHDLPFAFVQPGIDVRARYLALASSVAAEVRPVPEKSWARVDLDDLPSSLREALDALDLSAAWRLVKEPSALSVAVTQLPKASTLPAVVRQRETTTLLTVDGTLLHRDRFTVDGGGEVFDVTLPEGGILWSARVGDQPVRPLEHGGRVSVPLGFEGETSVVEVVSVLERAVPEGRSRLGLDLPRVGIPVLDHRWRLLLPEGSRYRFREGDLRPISAREALRKGRPGAMAGLPVRGPGGTSGVRGKVVDDQGLPIAGAIVTLNNFELQIERTTATASDGSFLFSLMPAGPYSATVTAEGRQPQVITLMLGRNEVIPLAVTLSPGDVIAEEIRVNAEQIGASALRRLEAEQKRQEERLEKENQARLYETELESLRNGLVGGVKPLPVSIPEAGKALVLTGVLPPERVAAELEVRAK